MDPETISTTTLIAFFLIGWAAGFGVGAVMFGGRRGS